MDLFEIDNRYRELLEKLEEPDADVVGISRELEALDGEKTDKIGAIAKHIKELDIDIGAIKSEIDNLKEKMDKKKASYEKNRDFLMTIMQMFSMPKCKVGAYTVTLQKVGASLVITDESAIPAEFVSSETVSKIDKKALKEFLKDKTHDCGFLDTSKITVVIR